MVYLKLNSTILCELKKNALQTYPYECCGALLGKFDKNTKIAYTSIKLENKECINKQYSSFKIDSKTMLNIDITANELGLDIIGFYHSHPDCSAAMSAYDVKNSIPLISNVILSVKNMEIDEIASWQLSIDRKFVFRETIEF